MSEFNGLNFFDELQPDRWQEEMRLHTPTFEATLKADGTLWLRGAALSEGFTVEAAQALTRFLSARIPVPPLEPVYGFSDFTPQRVEDSTEYLNDLSGHNQAVAWERAQEAAATSEAEIDALAEQYIQAREEGEPPCLGV